MNRKARRAQATKDRRAAWKAHKLGRKLSPFGGYIMTDEQEAAYRADPSIVHGGRRTGSLRVIPTDSEEAAKLLTMQAKRQAKPRRSKPPTSARPRSPNNTAKTK